jgi:CheY-like chemotaxis protein
MSRILLVDDSPHAQRMGERILSDEGYEVVTVSNADSALIRLDDVDPDVVVADSVMPGRTGYEICQYLKMSPRHRFVRVILTAGVLEAFDEERARRVEADGTVKKPFEASALLGAVKPLAEAAGKARAEAAPGSGEAAPLRAKAEVPFVAVVDAEQVHAAVTVALDASMQAMVDQITRRVLAALRAANTEPRLAESRVPELPRESASAAFSVPEFRVPALPESAAAASSVPEPAVAGPRPSEASGPAAAPAAPSAPVTRAEPGRRVTPLRIRSGSILGLDIGEPEPPTPDPE